MCITCKKCPSDKGFGRMCVNCWSLADAEKMGAKA